MAGGAPRALHPNVIQRNSRWFKFATLKATLETNRDKGEMRACAAAFLGLETQAHGHLRLRRRPAGFRAGVAPAGRHAAVQEGRLRAQLGLQPRLSLLVPEPRPAGRRGRPGVHSGPRRRGHLPKPAGVQRALRRAARRAAPDAQREAEEVIESAVQRAPRLERLQDVIDRVVDAALARGGRVALTSTEPLSVGEHGASGTRFDECCTTFWCASVQTLSSSPRAYASALWQAFLKDDQDCRVAGDDFLLTQLADGGTRCTFRCRSGSTRPSPRRTRCCARTPSTRTASRAIRSRCRRRH